MAFAQRQAVAFFVEFRIGQTSFTKLLAQVPGASRFAERRRGNRTDADVFLSNLIRFRFKKAKGALYNFVFEQRSHSWGSRLSGNGEHVQCRWTII